MVFVNAFDEIFVGPNAPTFKRNRVFGGFGYQFNDYVNANMAILAKRIYKHTGNRNLHFYILPLISLLTG